MSVNPEKDSAPVCTYARQILKETRRQKPSKMPAWLKQQRDAYIDRLIADARKSYRETGIWFLARGASRDKDEQETQAVWGELRQLCDLEKLPCYSKGNRQKAIEFWQSWQNLKTGRLYNPLYQDPQNPEIKRHTPGNRSDYSAETINVKYIPSILTALGAELPLPCNVEAHACIGEDTFDRLWGAMAKWHSSPSGMFPVTAGIAVDDGNLGKIPQVEAGMGALVRAYSRETGMWGAEPLENFPWSDYQPSSGFKIVGRICGYLGMENFPADVLKTAVDNLLAHKSELYRHPAMARNYGETFLHFILMSDYRRDEQLDAMEECLNCFRDPKFWENTGDASYCMFSSGQIGAYMNWEDLPPAQPAKSALRIELHGCGMKWRFIADPYGHWVNAMPKEPEAIFGHPQYDFKKYNLKARNKIHWAKKITDLIPQQDVALQLKADGQTGEGTFEFSLTADRIAAHKAPYLKATWNGAYDITLNGEPVKQVRYNLPDVPAGWYVPASAAKTLRVGRNTVGAKLIGPGKEPKPGAPLSKEKPFIRLGVIDWQ